MTAQTPIHSGFGPTTTAKEVLAGIDLSNKLALVTGGYSGIGLETTKALVAAGARVIVPARRPEVAAEALAGIANVETAALDLADLGSVASFADGLLASGQHIDIAILSAGIMATPETRVGPGWEAQFATNHLGHFALINRLRPLLEGGSRVVAVSSGAHGITGMRWHDLEFNEGYERWQAYGQAKTANVLFAVELDRLGKAHGIRAFALHPGVIRTPLQRHLSQAEMVEAGWIDETGKVVDPTFRSTEQGAATQVWAATSPQLAGMGGVYCEDCDVAPVSAEGKGVRPHAVDPAEAARLWAVSAELTGVNAF